jgi:hypothetical protein
LKNKNDGSFIKNRERYLAKHSFGNWKVKVPGSSFYNVVVVIPALAEYENIKKLLFSLSRNNAKYFNDILILFVVNNTKSAEEKIKTDNLKTIRFFDQLLSKNSEGEDVIETVINSGLNIGYIDAAASGFELPDKEGGVGLARKIGMDASLGFFNSTEESNFIIACLDSDCEVPENYLEEIHKLTDNYSFDAGHVKYEHLIENDETADAIICYEIFLYYYAAALKYSRSPYAFHTIGSTIICSAEAYIKIGGMNKRKAAEDFYFIEKLSKNYEIKKIDAVSVFPSSRVSFRVPFGTGQRVGRFLSGARNEYQLYSPESFEVLKKWNSVFFNENNIDGDFFIKRAKEISGGLCGFLTENNFAKEWERIVKNSKQKEQIQKQKKFWFDGFRTLKLVHYLRDSAHPMRPMFDALEEFFKMNGIDFHLKSAGKIPSVEDQKEYLKILRTLA